MNQELIDMAKEVGLLNETDEEYFVKVLRIEAFAALVAAAEREACAKVCEDVFTQSQIPFLQGVFTPETCVYAIRERGETK